VEDTAVTKSKVKGMKEGNVSIYGSHKTMKVVKVGIGSTVLSNEKGLCGSRKVVHKRNATKLC
jgi:ribosomal protein S8